MSKGLQEFARATRTTRTTDEPIDLVLDHNYARKVTEDIKNAKEEINICAYAWRWYETQPEIDIQKLNIALMRAKQRGVRVRCLLDGFKVFQVVKKHGFNARYIPQAKMLHTKAVCIDRKLIYIGSHNLTKRANQENFETSIKTSNYDVIDQFMIYFEKIWAYAYES